mmetsp:Transcript_48133/g.58051  ORF Transcript_48133/g.58051 Transcript_48133/m.58051 type:complete len:93 (+) Transcript_48133:259-537(+)
MSTTVETRGANNLSFVVTGWEESADDYIVKALKETDTASKVYVVTADRELRRRARNFRRNVVSVNPVKFWKKYRPRLSMMKSTYENNGLQKK